MLRESGQLGVPSRLPKLLLSLPLTGAGALRVHANVGIKEPSGRHIQHPLTTQPGARHEK